MNNLPQDIKSIINDCYPYIKEFNPAQKAVIESGYLEKRDNWVIAIPTASGKTVLGIMAALKAILEGGKAVYAAPLISIQNEKVKEFKKFEEHGISVGKHPGSADLSVMVFESFDALTRFSWDTLREVDTIIIDEFHMIGEFSRGPTIECAITRAKIINPNLRVIALSATLENMDEIENWLDATVVEHDYRPVPLKKNVLNTEMFSTKNKNDVIVKILEKAMNENSQALSFVSTRRFTESLATYVASKLKNKTSAEQKARFKEVARKLLEVPEKKGSRPTTTCLKLAEACENGAVFHHAGLFSEQKEIIEDEFRNGNILMIAATPSLMYGVNLPSKYVIHTVGPAIPRESRPSKLDCEALKSCYVSCLEIASQNNLESLAFCAISTGVFNFPRDLAAEIAVGTVKDYLDSNETSLKYVIFDVFSDDSYETYRNLLF